MNGIFEVKENESISDLLLYNKGIDFLELKVRFMLKQLMGYLNLLLKTVSKDDFKIHFK